MVGSGFKSQCGKNGKKYLPIKKKDKEGIFNVPA